MIDFLYDKFQYKIYQNPLSVLMNSKYIINKFDEISDIIVDFDDSLFTFKNFRIPSKSAEKVSVGKKEKSCYNYLFFLCSQSDENSEISIPFENIKLID
mgnify:CR=1 FL=1